MLKRKLLPVLLLLFIFLLTGCNSKYKLYIEKNQFKEHININFDLSKAINNSDREKLLFLQDNDIYAIDEYNDGKNGTAPYESLYQKKVYTKKNNTILDLTYSYKERDIKNSYVLTKCFSEHSFINSDTYYYINLSGKFLCGISKNNNIDINIITDNAVLKNNATSISGNKYYWNINDKNIDNVNILIKVSKSKFQNKTRYYLKIIISIALIMLILAYILFKIFGRRKNGL